MSQSQDALTPREMDVLKLLALGWHNKRIAIRLRVNERTIKYHVSAILSKLEVSNRTEAVTEAARRRLISLEEEQA
jgi:two-component system NarL family response regulator